MNVLDANLLIYAYDLASAQHLPARRWVEAAFSSSEPIGIPLQTITAFLRVMTHRNLPRARLSIEAAVQIVEEWLALPQVRLLLPGDGHWPHLRRMLLEGHAAGPLVTDAQIAALALEVGGIVQTNDRDFSRFPGLRWQNPLAG